MILIRVFIPVDSIKIDTTHIALIFQEPINETSKTSLEQSLNLTYHFGDNGVFFHYKIPSSSNYETVLYEISIAQNIDQVCLPKIIKCLHSVPNDPEYETGNNPLDIYTQKFFYSVMEIEDAWDYSTGSSNIIVSCGDTGFDIDHPDLANGNDGYSNYDVANSEDYTSTGLNDEVGHGTMVLESFHTCLLFM